MIATKTPQVCVGVDAGASKTRCVALAADGRCLGAARGPAATLNGPVAGLWGSIVATVHAIAPLADVSLTRASIVVGIAGFEITAAYQQFMAAPPACAKLHVVSDAQIACAGAHALDDGAVVAVGTGVIGYCRQGEDVRRVAGWGFPHDDCGSGAWIGMQAVRHALASADGRAASDALSARLLADFNGDTSALAAWACRAGASDFARYARVVAAQAGTGCVSANALLDAAAGHVAAVARTMPGQGRALPLALTGGLAATLAPRLAADQRQRLVPARHDGAHGAALLARQALTANQGD